MSCARRRSCPCAPPPLAPHHRPSDRVRRPLRRRPAAADRLRRRIRRRPGHAEGVVQAVHGQLREGDGHLSRRHQEAVREGQPRQEGGARPHQGAGRRVLHQAPADAPLPQDRARPGVRGHLPHQLRHHQRVLEAARRLSRRVEGLGPVHRHRQGRREGRGREDVRRPGRHRHAGAVVQQGHLREGGAARELAAADLGGRPRRRAHRQGEGARCHPAERLHRQAGRRGGHHADLRDAAVRHR